MVGDGAVVALWGGGRTLMVVQSRRASPRFLPSPPVYLGVVWIQSVDVLSQSHGAQLHALYTFIVTYKNVIFGLVLGLKKPWMKC